MPNAPRKDGKKKTSENADLYSYKSVEMFVCVVFYCYGQIFRRCNVYTVIIGHALK